LESVDDDHGWWDEWKHVRLRTPRRIRPVNSSSSGSDDNISAEMVWIVHEDNNIPTICVSDDDD